MLPPQLESHVLGFLEIASVARAWRVSRRMRRTVAAYLRDAATISFMPPPVKCNKQFRAARLLVELHCVALRELVVSHPHECDHGRGIGGGVVGGSGGVCSGVCNGQALRHALIELVQRNGATLTRVQAPTPTGFVYRTTSVALAISRACPRLCEPFYMRRPASVADLRAVPATGPADPAAPAAAAHTVARTANDDIDQGQVFCFRQLARGYSRHTITEIALAETGAFLPGVATQVTRATQAEEFAARLDVIVDTGHAIAAYLRESGGTLTRLTLRITNLPPDLGFDRVAGARLTALELDFRRGFRTPEHTEAALRSLPYVDACREIARACAQLIGLRRLDVTFDALFEAPFPPGAADRCRDALALTHDLEWPLPQLDRFRVAVAGRGWYALPLVVAPRLRTVYARGFTLDSVGRLLADDSRHLVTFECEHTERDPAYALFSDGAVRERTSDGGGGGGDGGGNNNDRTAAWEAILNCLDDGKSGGSGQRASQRSSPQGVAALGAKHPHSQQSSPPGRRSSPTGGRSSPTGRRSSPTGGSRGRPSLSRLRVLHIDPGLEAHMVTATRVGARGDQLARMMRRFPNLQSLVVRPTEARTQADDLFAILRQCPRLQWCELSGTGYCVTVRRLMVHEIIEHHVDAAGEAAQRVADEAAPRATGKAETDAEATAADGKRETETLGLESASTPINDDGVAPEGCFAGRGAASLTEIDHGNASSLSSSPSSLSAPLVFTHSQLVGLFLDDVGVEFWRGARLPRVSRTHQTAYRHDLAPVFTACPLLTSFSAFSGAGWECTEPPNDEAKRRLAQALALATDTPRQPPSSTTTTTTTSLATETLFRAPDCFLFFDEPMLAALPQALAWFPHLRILMLPRTAPTWVISALAALLPRLPALVKIDMAHTRGGGGERSVRAPEPPGGDGALRRAAAVEAYSDLGAAAIACRSRLAEIALSPLQSREHNEALAYAVRAALPAWNIKWLFVA